MVQTTPKFTQTSDTVLKLVAVGFLSVGFFSTICNPTERKPKKVFNVSPLEYLQVATNVCQAHATAIAANKGSHKTHFDNMARYEDFYECVCSIMRCFFVDSYSFSEM